MWTEVATGAEAHSVRRWLRRAIAPRAARWMLLFALMLIAGLVYSELLRPQYNPVECRMTHPEPACVEYEDSPKSLLDWLF